MTLNVNNDAFDFLGTDENDILADGVIGTDDKVHSEASDDVVKINGLEGDDVITTSQGDSLGAGDMVGDEWRYEDGKWVYNKDAVIVSDYGKDKSYNDIITTGAGDDVLLGNGGDDIMSAGNGNDILNGGRGNDQAFGGNGNDIINLEDGDDYAEAGLGDDIVNAGDGSDVVYGDLKGNNLLSNAPKSASTFNGLAQSGAWTMVDTYGGATISQSAETVVGETYTISFDLAANLSGGHATGKVEVLWNGEVVDTVEATSGAYQTFEIEVVSTGNEGELSFHALTPEANAEYNFDGPIVTYDKEMSIGGQDVTVKAFAAGQAKLYQVIDGQLNVFDVQSEEYVAAGNAPDFKINAVGFNVEDDMIYGVAKSAGTDSLGNAVANTDIVMVDAEGATYRIGDGFYADYVGDFDDSGNLWTFHSGLNRASVVDVDNLDADGNPSIQHFHFPGDLFADRTYDLAFNAEDGNFYAVVSPNRNGNDGKVVKIDVSQVTAGGLPSFSEVAITGTLYGDEMEAGMAKGAYGAVFLDGEGNLYYGLNKGDHDLDQTTGSQGSIFKVNVDWDAGQAYSEFMSVAPSTSSNDGAVDPRSIDAFAEVDAEAAVLIREPSLSVVEGGNDDLRGGDGNDEMHGNGGDDELNGGNDDDILYGDQGNDNLSGGSGNDWMSGGVGDDKMRGDFGNDTINGDDGKDYINGGTGNDTLSGGNGVDKIVGGTGADTIEGGAGNDNLWGGNWSGDDTADTFVFKSGTGKDYVHDFEAEQDLIDLSSFSVDYDAVKEVTTDLGWATVVDLQQLDGGVADDRIVLKFADMGELDSSNFIL